MYNFLKSLFSNGLSAHYDFRKSIYQKLKTLLIVSIVPIVLVSGFVTCMSVLESLVYSAKWIFGDTVISLFIGYFWSGHVNLCVSIIVSLKMTVYFYSTYSDIRKFQFQSIRVLK